jgi:hypothetical protein
MMKGYRTADAYIQAFDKTVHGNFHVFIRQVHRFRREPVQFVSEEECRSAGFKIEVFEVYIVRMRGGGDNAVSLLLQTENGFPGIVLIPFPPPVYIEPLAGTEGYSLGNTETVSVFYNMYILNTESVAASQHRAGVVGLIDVLKDHGQVSGPTLQRFEKAFPPLGTDELHEIFYQFFFV